MTSENSIHSLEGSSGQATVLARSIGGEFYKVGDYIFLVDTEGKEVLCSRWGPERLSRKDAATDGPYYPLGGGRAEGESSEECAIREALEETSGALALSKSQLTFLRTLVVRSPVPFRYVESSPFMVGKEMNMFEARIPKQGLNAAESRESDGQIWKFSWFPAAHVFGSNEQLDASAWVAICRARTAPCFGMRPPSNLVWDALALACELHKGQVDKGGNPYIGHVTRVALGVPQEEEPMVVALLHDLEEDKGSAATAALQSLKLSKPIQDALRLLRRDKSIDYKVYIQQLVLSGNVLALQVKRSDLIDNTSRPEQISTGQLQRYREALVQVERALGQK